MMHTTLCASPTGAFQNLMLGGMDTNMKLMLLAVPWVKRSFDLDLSLMSSASICEIVAG